jgi:hypothetical protein
MRTNCNGTTEQTKTLGKKNTKPLDVNDLLIETRLCGRYGIASGLPKPTYQFVFPCAYPPRQLKSAWQV